MFWRNKHQLQHNYQDVWDLLKTFGICLLASCLGIYLTSQFLLNIQPSATPLGLDGNGPPVMLLREDTQIQLCFGIVGLESSRSYRDAVEFGQKIRKKHKNVVITTNGFTTRDEWERKLASIGKTACRDGDDPAFVYMGCEWERKSLIGGLNEFVRFVRRVFPDL